MERKGYETESYHVAGNDMLCDFYNEFIQDSNFQRRMKCYVETVDSHPDLKSQIDAMAEIPLKYKFYYNTLGTAKIRSLNYKEAYLEREVHSMQSRDSVIEKLRDYVIQAGIPQDKAIAICPLRLLGEVIKVSRIQKWENYMGTILSSSLTLKSSWKLSSYM